MIFPVAFHTQYFHYFLQRDVTKLYIAVAIRNLALGLVTIFEPIYIYQHFNNSFPAVMFYYAVLFGLYGLFVVFGGRIMAKFGPAKSILLSYPFYIVYYVFLYLMPVHWLFVPLAVIVAVTGMLLFWPAFHTDFVRFSTKEHRGREASRINVAMMFPTILAPVIGGIVLMQVGFPILFTIVGLLLFASSIPLFYSRERVEVYTDSYTKAWKRIFKKDNRILNIGLLSEGIEISIHAYVWPIFLLVLAIDFSKMGGIASFALVGSTLFMLYIGKLSDTEERPWLLNIGALWTGISWIIKFFVTPPFDALLGQMIYRISRAAARVPFWTFFYEKAASKEDEADEFIVYREILVNIGLFFFFSAVAIIFLVFPKLPIQTVFFAGAALALGFVFLGKPPKLSFRKTRT